MCHNLRLGFVALFAVVTVLSARAAHACGGGLVARADASVASDVQRIFLAVGETSTEVVTVVEVPPTDQDFGVLLPVPALPTLDGTPVPAEELDRLIAGTNPRITIADRRASDDGGGCGCAGHDSKTGAGAPRTGNPQVGGPITIGPVVAVVLDASAPAALEAWLADNAFTIPAAQQSLIGSYSGAGRAFVAIRRKPGAVIPAGAPATVGVHMTLPGDQRALPMRFGRLGAGASVAYTVFVAAKTGVATALPFQTLGINDFESDTLAYQGYDAALAQVVASQRGHAFVAEALAPVSDLVARGALGPRLAALTGPGQIITRLSTRVARDLLDSDVEFTIPAEGPVPTTRTIVLGFLRDVDDDDAGGGGPGSFLWLALAALAFGGAHRLRGRRATRAPAAETARAPMCEG